MINSYKNDHYSQSNQSHYQLNYGKWYVGKRAVTNYFILFDLVTKYVIKRCQSVRKICQTKLSRCPNEMDHKSPSIWQKKTGGSNKSIPSILSSTL